MASFTNRKGEKVEVSDELLNRAIELYEELKKVSPSGRVSWANLKRFLHKEGYSKADSNESFRQLIKRERGKLGMLPSASKHAELVTSNKVDALKEEIGEWRLSKREAQDEFIRLNRLKRNLIRDNAVIEIIKEELGKVDFSNIEFTPVVIPELSVKDMVACLSDLHYGAIVEIGDNEYNQDIAERLILEYADKILLMAEEENVETIHVVGLGDIVEHATMRNSNTFTAESHWSDQVVSVSKIIVKFLTKLSKYTNVTYSAIAGNHDRISGNKNDNLYGDSAVNISNSIVEIAVSSNDRIEFIPTEPYHHIKEVNGFNFLFVHGDQTKIKSPDVLGQMSLLHGVNFDALLSGHIHHYTVREVGNNKYVATFGSIKGSDDFSMSIGVSSSRSQGVILVGEDDFEIRKVNL